MRHALRDIFGGRDWARIWRDAPGKGWGWGTGGICCCSGAVCSQTYHAMGGLTTGTPSTRRNTNYQYAPDAWTAKATLDQPIDSMAGATPACPGSAYKYGGLSSNSPFWLTQADSYTPDAWTSQTAMPTPGRYRASGCAISALNYSMAGWNSTNTVQSQNDQMTPGSPSTWATKTAMTQARANGAASYIAAKGYFFCGDNSAPAQTQTTYEYDPSGNSWATKSNIPTPARNGMAAFTISATAYIINGGPVISPVNDSYVVDTWTAKTAPPSANDRQFVGGASNDSGGIGYITGGLLQTGATVATHEEYVPDTWATRAVLPITIQNTLSLYA